MSNPRPATEPARPPSRWRIAYHRYRAIEKRLTDEGPPSYGPLALLRASAQGRRTFQNRLSEYRALLGCPNKGGLPALPPKLIDELQAHADLKSSYWTGGPGFVFEDVYHLAFEKLGRWRRLGEVVKPAKECLRLYRGQRVDTWAVGASIYRGVPFDETRRGTLDSRVDAAKRLGKAIAAKFGLSFVDAMAVCQHYSESELLGLPTWLVDFSRDPWVGLFFASDYGKSGDRGIVWDVMTNEYEGLTAGKSNPIGALQLAVPPGILRIDHQSGVFVTAGLPQIFDQYVAFGGDTLFLQHTGEVFEDPIMGITRDRIYPPDDPLRQILRELKAALNGAAEPPDTPDSMVPPAVFSDPYDPRTYEALLDAWLEVRDGARSEPTPSDGERTSPSVREGLRDLARYHALLHTPRYASRLPIMVSRSLNRLESAFDTLRLAELHGRTPSARDAIESAYIQHYFHHEVLREALNEMLPPATQD